MSSRGSSPALPTYRDEGGSGVDRVGTPGCSTPPEPASTADLERFILQVWAGLGQATWGSGAPQAHELVAADPQSCISLPASA